MIHVSFLIMQEIIVEASICFHQLIMNVGARGINYAFWLFVCPVIVLLTT